MRLSGWTLIFPSQKSHSDRLLAVKETSDALFPIVRNIGINPEPTEIPEAYTATENIIRSEPAAIPKLAARAKFATITKLAVVAELATVAEFAPVRKY